MVACADPCYAISVMVHRTPWLPALIGVMLSGASATALAQPEADDAPEEAKPKKVRDPDEGIARPDAEDLRSGHFLISVSGGAWIPSNPLFPAFAELGDPSAGGTAHLHLGLGLNRYMVLELSGGFAMAPSAVDSCDGCSATSIDAGGAFVFHPTQGFAFDPWISYGVGYRHNILSLDTEDAPATSAFDFTKVGLGGTYFPVPVFGFGPYLETDVGVRDFDDPTFYAAFHIGMRVTFDPLRSGASASPAATTGQLGR